MTNNSGASSYGSTSTSLLAGVRARDEVAWHQFVELYGPLIYFWCRQYGLQENDARDVMQQVFAKVLTGLGTVRRQRPEDTFRGWLWTVTRNVLHDHARERARQAAARGGTDAYQQMSQLADSMDSETTQSLTAGHDDLLRRAWKLIQAEFNAPAQQVVRLTVLDGLNASEAARQLGLTPAAVRQIKSRVLRRLREALGDAE